MNMAPSGAWYAQRLAMMAAVLPARAGRASRLVLLLAGAAWLPPTAEGRIDCPGCVPVFYDGLNGSKCYRIPTIIKTHTGALLAFSENRFNECSDDHAHALVLRRSLDLGLTWEPMQEVTRDQVAPCPGCEKAIANPNPLEVDFKDGTYAVLLMYATLNNPHRDKHGEVMQIWSHDDGLTWGPPSRVSFPPQENLGGLPGPSSGIQSQKGTLVFSAGFPDCCRFLFWSRDFGKTWRSSQQMDKTDGEATIAFLNNHMDKDDESIIINMRQDGKNQRMQRTWTWTGDNEGTWGPELRPAELVDANCQGSLINQKGTLLLSNVPMGNSERSHLTVKSSKNQGFTWEEHTLVWEGPSAYSQLVPLGDDKVGIIFEAGFEQCYEGIWFTHLSLASGSVLV